MNLFQKYGIKEVADVTFYSITKVGTEEFYVPVLHLDTLKVSTLSQKSEKVKANGGYANQKVMSWNFGKEITLDLQDALFSQASMSLTFGWLSSELSKYTSAIAKLNLAYKYYKLNYSTYAFPSPQLTDDEWELVFAASNRGETILEEQFKGDTDILIQFINSPYVAEARTKIKQIYSRRDYMSWVDDIVSQIFKLITKIQHFGYIDTDNYELECIDRMELCYVPEDGEFVIDTKEQFENLKAYYCNDKTHSYNIYYDIKTMQPLLLDENGNLIDQNLDATFTLKGGTAYYKWSRTVRPKIDDSSILGKTLAINATTFPSQFRIVGETYIREQRTQIDQRYQFIINRAAISTDTDIELHADGDPTTFSMKVDVLPLPNEDMIELRQFNVEEDKLYGGTKILPQDTKYRYTAVNIDEELDSVDNQEIY